MSQVEILRPFWCHAKAFYSDKRFVYLRAGRRSGKTHVAKLKLVTSTSNRLHHDKPGNYLYCGPTLPQAKEVAWNDLKDMMPANCVRKISETELKITTHWGATLKIAGLDKPHRIEGQGYDGVVVDERSDVKPEAIGRSIIPALGDRKGWLWQIGVPKRYGIGAKSFNETFSDVLAGKIPDSLALEWESSEIMDTDELELLKAQMSQEDFDEQFRAMILKVGGQVYHAFSQSNVKPCTYDKTKPLIVGSDFNVDPMCWTIGQEHGDEFHVIDVLWKRNTNTYDSLNALHAAYGGHDRGWVFHGDASSRSRKTSSIEPDLAIIVKDDRFINKRVLYRKKNPAIEARLSATNAMMLNASGRRRLFIDPIKGARLIEDYQSRSRKEGTQELNDGPFQGHLADSCDYIMHARYPVRIGSNKGAAGVATY